MVFMSHSSKDYEAVKEWVDYIEILGMKCWISERDISDKNGSWADAIMQGLKESDIFFLYLTKESAGSEQVMNEVHNASAEGKNIIPVLAENITVSNEVLYLIRKYQWIRAYQYEDKESLKNVVRKRLFENINEDRDTFWNTIGKPEYRTFVYRVLEKYYGKEFFTTINGESYPVFSIKAKPMEEKPGTIDCFDSYCDFDNSCLSDFDVEDHQDYVNLKWYDEYSYILSGKIRYPNRPGYMLDEFSLDEDGNIDKIRVHVGTYAENVYSTHILEYEMYRAYLLFQEEDLDDPAVWNNVRDFLEIRNNMHKDVDLKEKNAEQMRLSLMQGAGRDSLLSVQMAVVVKSNRSHKYEVKFIQRSTQVAVKPGVYQLIPSGGFEILNDSDDDIYDDMELEENFSLGCAIFREYIEELFNVPEFEGGGEGSIEDRLLKDPHVVDIEKMLSEGRAEFLFLGSVISLEGLRHELSFVLVIHDETYSENRFLANEECKKGRVNSVPVQDFGEKKSVWKQLHEPSAAMWDLFTKTDVYNQLIQQS